MTEPLYDASANIPEAIRAMGEQYAQDIVSLRRHFHAHPELSRKEFDTSDFICAQLDELGVEYRRVQGAKPSGEGDFIGTGILATLRGEAPGAYDEHGVPATRVALRTDMDALPVAERTGVEYSSENEGVMHACGHDCHMAMMLGAVRMLDQLKGSLRGEVRVLFQPAEEISVGAKDLIAAGALDGVDAIFGMHIWSDFDAGLVSCEAGPRMGNTDWFRIDIEGTSAHGSMPHKGVDAIGVAAEIVDELQVIVSRRVSPFEPVVITVGEIHGGTAPNIMAGSAYLTGTVRTWRREMRDAVANRMERIAGKTAHAFGAQLSFSYKAGNPGVVNDEACAEVARAAAEKVLGPSAVGHYEGTLAGEDFAEYQKMVPGVFVFLGTRNPEIGADFPQHSCYYQVDESVLPNGAMLAAQWACDMLS